jgi:hypothetical protein
MPGTLNWKRVMKTIQEDPQGFFNMGGWECMLHSDSDVENDDELDPGDEDFESDDYAEPDDDDDVRLHTFFLLVFLVFLLLTLPFGGLFAVCWLGLVSGN